MTTIVDDWQQDFARCLVVRDGAIADPFTVKVDVALKAKEVASATYSVDGEGAKLADGEPDVTVALSAADASAMEPGELPLGFMRGAIKITGDPKLAVVLLKAAAK